MRSIDLGGGGERCRGVGVWKCRQDASGIDTFK